VNVITGGGLEGEAEEAAQANKLNTQSSYSVFSHPMWAVFGGLHAIVAVGACVRLVAKIMLKAKRLILALHLLVLMFCALLSSVCFGFFFFNSAPVDNLTALLLVWAWSYPLVDLVYMLIALSWSDIVKVCLVVSGLFQPSFFVSFAFCIPGL